jgi:hypothetical protein
LATSAGEYGSRRGWQRDAVDPGAGRTRTCARPGAEIDDVFYEARGASWALIHFLKAAQVDFAEVLRMTRTPRSACGRSSASWKATQGVVWSPMILNGTGFGLLANHSLVMASYISRANAAIIDLRDLLSQG